MNRRRLVQTVMAMFAGASLHGGTANAQSRPSGPSTGHCLVIGAGLAGLAAASGLRAKGHAVTVLEARERIGGRIWTSDRWPDMPLDLGASWIHGTTDNPLTALADRIGAQRISTTYNATRLWNTRGQPLTDNEIESLDTLLESFEAAVEAAQDGEQDVSIRAVAERMITRAGDDASFRRRLGFIVNSTLEQEYAGSAAELSTYWHDHHEGFDGEDVLFAQGFQVIPNHLAEGIVVNKGCIVREIHWGRSPVRVVTDTAVFEGSRVLVTLPLGVLKSGDVRFVPELPKDKRLAIRHLGMGVLNKCYLRFDRVYWPKDVDWLEIIPERHGEWTEWVSFARAAQWPVLLGFNAADHGRDIEAQGDEAIVDSAMTVLRRLFGTSLPEPIDHQISRWASDPFARGSYSFNALGSHPAMRGTLSRPLGQRLFFAGEATEADHFGTAHGAVLSGYRAAAQMSATTK